MTSERLRHQPGYSRFYAAATVARVADEMFSVGVVLLILERTGSAALAGATVAAITLPSLVTAPLLGAWLDVTGRRSRLMVFDQLVIAAALVGIVLATGNAPDWVLPLIALAAGITYPLSFGGFTSLIPVIVPGRLLAPANALETASFNTALVVGPALAGTLAALFGPASALIVEAVLSVAALGLILGIPMLDRGGEAVPRVRELLAVAREGLRQIVEVPRLRGVTAAGAMGLAGMGLLVVTFPLLAVEELGQPRSVAGYLWASFAVGSTVGALALVPLQRRIAPERIVVGAISLFGCLMFLWPLADSLAVMMGLVALAALADGPGLAATFAVRQQVVPPRLHGQVFTTAAGLKVGAFALGAGVAGPLVEAVGPQTALVIAACVQLAAAGGGLALMQSRRSAEPARASA